MFYLDELLAETRRTATILGASKEIDVRVSGMSESPCYGDEDLLRQMILNLLDNAVKYTSPKGVVTLSLEHRNGAYSISVSDTGPGIPPEAQAYVFDRFFRADKTRSRIENTGPGAGTGAGLGLAIARSIAEAHGGSVSLEHSDSSGTTFVVELPAGNSH